MSYPCISNWDIHRAGSAALQGLGFALIRAMDTHAVNDIMAITLLLFVFAASVNALLGFVERQVRHGG